MIIDVLGTFLAVIHPPMTEPGSAVATLAPTPIDANASCEPFPERGAPVPARHNTRGALDDELVR